MIGSFIQGGLGNQLFQIAAGYSHAKKIQSEFAVIDGQHHLPLQGNNTSTYKHNILRNVISKPEDHFSNCRVFDEQGHHYTSLPLEDNLFLRGYFQSEKYFENCKDEILELFSVTPFIEKTLKKNHPYVYDEKVVSLHVRRGDFLQNPNIHPTMEVKYYQEALECLKDKDRVVVFSDDIGWCKKHFDAGFTYSSFNEDYLDLYLMTKCYHHILANSTFSWWGAWLSRTEGTIIAPSIWFGPNGPQDTQDIIPVTWKRV